MRIGGELALLRFDIALRPLSILELGTNGRLDGLEIILTNRFVQGLKDFSTSTGDFVHLKL